MKSFILETDGKGLWSNEKRKVKITDISLGCTKEIQVYFSKKTWNPDKHGLIYTDRAFINGLRKHLINSGMPKKIANDIDYTEQGMQGDDYVSLEYGKVTEKYLLNKLIGD